MARQQPINYYYSGQGILLIGDRDPETGEGYNMRFVGNCTALSGEIAVEKFEHAESTSGQRSTDKTIIKKKTATVKFTAESLSLDNLAVGLFGETASVVGAAVTDEEHRYTAGVAMIPFKFPNVSLVTVTTGATAGAATPVPTDAYLIDAGFGTLHIKDSSAFTGPKVFFDYTYGASKRLDIFTKSLPDEKFLRFEGLNTVNDDLVLVNMPRVAFDPLPALQLINEEFGSVEFTGSILLDPTILTGSQFMTQTIIEGAA